MGTNIVKPYMKKPNLEVVKQSKGGAINLTLNHGMVLLRIEAKLSSDLDK